ncbi:hypothetical protein RSAG8_13398, partial [Rhizoctonia solani AG-8 WAC10335]
MKFILVVAALFADYAAAQSGGPPPKCVENCATQAALANCAGMPFTDPKCACANTGFQQTALQCLQSSCTAEETQLAIQLLKQACGVSKSETNKGVASD